MVKQIELRGPFLSLADFVNRQLVEAGDDGNDLALKGALQSALDAVVNDGMSGPGDVDIDYHINYFADPEYVQESLLSGFPGYLLQSDILASIGQYLAVRSDTFRIRSYGEADLLSNRGGKTRVWIESIVQRVPDYVEPEANSAEDSIGELVTANDEFGRAFRVVSMRWLRPEEI